MEPKPCKAKHWKAISEEGELYLKAYVMEHPDLTLEALCDHYQLVYGVEAGVTTMHNALKRMGITRKKNILRPQQVQRRQRLRKRELHQCLRGREAGRLRVFGRIWLLSKHELGLWPVARLKAGIRRKPEGSWRAGEHGCGID